MFFIPISTKASYTGIPNMVITYTDLSGSQDFCMLPVLPCLLGPPIKLTGLRITTGTGLSAHILSFVNRTTGWWSALFLPFISVLPRTLLSIHSPRRFTSTIMWLCCIATAYHTPASSLMAGAILRIGTEIT